MLFKIEWVVFNNQVIYWLRFEILLNGYWLIYNPLNKYLSSLLSYRINKFLINYENIFIFLTWKSIISETNVEQYVV